MKHLLQYLYRICGILILFLFIIIKPLFPQDIEIDEVENFAYNETSTIVPVGYGYGNLGPYVVHGKMWVFYSDGTDAYWRTKSIGEEGEWSDRRFLFQESQGAFFNVAFDGTYFHFVRQVNDNGGWGDLEYRRGKAEGDGDLTFTTTEIIYSDLNWKVSNRHFSIYSDSRNSLWIMAKVHDNNNNLYKSIVFSSIGDSGEWTSRPGFPKDLNGTTSSDINGRGPKIIEIEEGKILFSWRNHGAEDSGIFARLWIENNDDPDGEGILGDVEDTQIGSSQSKSGETSIVSPAPEIAMVNSGRSVSRRDENGTWQRVDPPSGIIEDDNLRSNSLSVNGSAVRVWDVDGGDIRYSETTNYGSSWGTIVVRTTTQSPSHLSASHVEGSKGSFHAALWRSGENPFDIGMSIEGTVEGEAVTPPAEPLLVSPDDGVINVPVEPLLVWENVEDADSYAVQVSKNSDMVDPVIYESGVADTLLQVSLEYETQYYWHVSATNEGGTGEWSAMRSFTTVPDLPGQPVLAVPENGAVDVSVSPVLSWEDAEKADEYTVQVSRYSDFSNQVVNVNGITDTQYQVSLSTETKYYWRVRAVNDGGNGEWSTVWSFTTVPAAPTVPVLATPDDGAENISIDTTLVWEQSSRAENYQLQLSEQSNFSSVFIDSVGIEGTSLSINDLSNLTNYYWRVKAINAGGESDWSTVWSFTTEDVTSVDRIVEGIPVEFSLDQNYPNPFNPVTTIRFALPSEANVRLEIYNMLGQRVASIIDGEHYAAGIYEAIWDARDASGNEVSSGIYIYRISAGEFNETRKMILMK